MKRLASLFVVAALAVPVNAVEEIRNGAAADFAAARVSAQKLTKKPLVLSGAPAAAPALAAAPSPEPRDPLIQEPGIRLLMPNAVPGRLLGAFRMAERLDSHRDLFHLKLGALDWDMASAGDAKFDVLYLTFRRGGEVRLRRIENLNQLRGKGVKVRIDENTVYNFKIKINIFSPTRGSRLKIDPVDGTRGPKHSIKTGKILDAVERESFVFKAGGKEFWILYGTDVDPETNAFTDTRSLLFVHENGLSSKAWPVGDANITTGNAVEVTLGSTKLVLVKTMAGDLRIHAAAGASLAATR